MPYTCQVCFKTYTNKCWYDKHCLWCTDTPHDAKLRIEEMNDVPPVGIMYKMILDLSLKVSQLEEKCARLTKNQRKEENEKIDNKIEDSEPAYTTFKEWYTGFTFTQEFIEDLFTKNYNIAITEYIRENIEKEKKQSPLIIDSSTKKLYFYDSEKYGWKMMKRENFEPFIDKIILEIQNTFKALYNNDIEDFDKYLENVQKIMVAKNKSIMNSVYKELIIIPA